MKKSVNTLIFIMNVLFLLSNLIGFQALQVSAIKFNPVPFENLPVARINSDNGEYKLGADFSIDFGDETVIKKANDTMQANNMTLDKNDETLSLQLECDSNDECSSSLAPRNVKVYLVDADINDEQIAQNSIPTLELGDNDCGTKSIKDCANFAFSIPRDIWSQKYKIVVDMSFDEAEWKYINPVLIT